MEATDVLPDHNEKKFLEGRMADFSLIQVLIKDGIRHNGTTAMDAFRTKLMKVHKISAFVSAALSMSTKMQKVLALSAMPFIKKKRNGTIKDYEIIKELMCTKG